jgi:hypothetical protein
VRRYLPAEVAGTSGAVLGAVLALAAGGGAAGGALAATWAEVVGFYAFVTLRELRQDPRRGARPAVRGVRALRGVLAEYGLAEAADSLLLRPALMYLAAVSLGGILAGVVAGKLAADVVFYALAIPAYELRRRRRLEAVPDAEARTT